SAQQNAYTPSVGQMTTPSLRSTSAMRSTSLGFGFSGYSLTNITGNVYGPDFGKGRPAVARNKVRKKGKLLISHRCDRLPLLASTPGGFSRSWSYKTYPAQR